MVDLRDCTLSMLEEEGEGVGSGGGGSRWVL